MVRIKMKKVGVVTTLMVLVVCGLLGCSSKKEEPRITELSDSEAAFFGDSTLVFLSNKLQNGYRVSIIHNKDITLVRFERGDSINCYCALDGLPSCLDDYEGTSAGVYKVDINIPEIYVDTLGGSTLPKSDIFFMDVNFDNEEDFIVAHDGYNRTYYACFDLVKGNSKSICPGFIEPIQEEPYNNLVSGFAVEPSFTVFNRKDKKIYIYERMGCCSSEETWAKYFEGDKYGTESKVKVYKKEHHKWWADGTEHVEVYKLINDTLRMVK